LGFEHARESEILGTHRAQFAKANLALWESRRVHPKDGTGGSKNPKRIFDIDGSTNKVEPVGIHFMLINS
jgi:hypothetical protein